MRIHQVAGAPLRLDQRHQRLLGAERVPQAQVGNEMEALGMVHLIVRAAIAAVHIHGQVRRHQCVVERRVKALLHRRRSLEIDRAEARSSTRPWRAARIASKSKPGDFGVHVGDGAFLAHRRERHLHHERLAVRG